MEQERSRERNNYNVVIVYFESLWGNDLTRLGSSKK